MQRCAFTLAEVLITLGIIGIIASLTIPALTAGYKKKEYSVRLKRFYSVISQAIKLSEIDNGDISNWTFVSSDSKDSTEKTHDFLNMYILPYLKVTKVNDEHIKNDDGALAEYNLVRLYFNDGSTVYIKNGSCLDMYYDVNSDKGPDKLGYDRYTFAMCLKPDISWLKNKIPFGAWGYGDNTDMTIYNDRDHQLNGCKNSGSCARLLQIDGFEYKDDYPIKFN